MKEFMSDSMNGCISGIACFTFAFQDAEKRNFTSEITSADIWNGINIILM
jgi:hypothetical protein